MLIICSRRNEHRLSENISYFDITISSHITANEIEGDEAIMILTVDNMHVSNIENNKAEIVSSSICRVP